VNAPETRRSVVKLAASMPLPRSASRHSSELAAKASIAKVVSSSTRAGRPCPTRGSMVLSRASQQR
jgi:hypothetical protein